MSAQIISGKDYAAGLRDRIKTAVSSLPGQPTLAVVIVGDDPASHVYVKNKIKFTIETGMRSVEHKLPADIGEDELVEIVRALNADAAIWLVRSDVICCAMVSMDPGAINRAKPKGMQLPSPSKMLGIPLCT